MDGSEPLSAAVQGVNMSHGANYLTLVGAGLGLMIPHVEATVGAESVSEYQLTGPAFQPTGGLAYPLASRLSVSGEYRFTRGSASVDIPGGTLDTRLYTHHLVAGPSPRLPWP